MAKRDQTKRDDTKRARGRSARRRDRTIPAFIPIAGALGVLTAGVAAAASGTAAARARAGRSRPSPLLLLPVLLAVVLGATALVVARFRGARLLPDDEASGDGGPDSLDIPGAHSIPLPSFSEEPVASEEPSL